MWHMSSGDRVLNSAEAKLVIEAAGMMVDELTEESVSDIQSPYQVPFFDNQPWQLRLKLLAEVVPALIDADVPAPELTAYHEATVAAIFHQAGTFLTMEIENDDGDTPEPDSWRQLAFDCIEQLTAEDVGDDFQPTALESDDIDRWDREIELIRDRILWDEDFLMHDPQSLNQVTLPDVDPEYFSNALTFPEYDEIERLWCRIRAITHVGVEGVKPDGSLQPSPNDHVCPKCGSRSALAHFHLDSEIGLVVAEGESEKRRVPPVATHKCLNSACGHQFARAIDVGE